MDCRVLSFQSHVVSGYVGNKAAIFPLQLLGFDVDFINSVQFSNHTGYPILKGTSITGEELDNIIHGLHENRLDNYDYLLTGFINSEETLNQILNMLTLLKTVNAKIKYICDPVLGDDGSFYVSQSLVPIFIQKILPQAYVITPNQFEAELLSGPSIVVITSVEFKSEPGKLFSYILDASASSMTISKIAINKLPGHFTGTGDCAAALLLAWTHKLGVGKGNQALENVMKTLQGMINLTIDIQLDRKRLVIKDRISNAASIDDVDLDKYLIPSEISRFAELCVIQSKRIIENPPEGDLFTIDIPL